MSRFSLALIASLALAACNTPDAFYRTLAKVPQIEPLSKTLYGVGDTLTLQGKLGGPGASIQVLIGGVAASIVSHTTAGDYFPSYPGATADTVIDIVKVVITSTMGIGINRPVRVTVDGVERNVGSITIVAAPPISARSDTIVYGTDSLLTYTTYSAGGNQILARSQVGDGRVYLLSGDTLIVGSNRTRTVLTAKLADQYGPFHVIGSAGTEDVFMSVDETGRYLYASLITSDTSAASATNLIFRLIKIDLHSYAIQTLNRTIFPIDQTLVTPQYAAALKMTGAVGSVFLPPVAQIFPGADGSVYFVVNGVGLSSVGPYWASYILFLTNLAGDGFEWASTVGKIDPSGQVSYLVKSAGNGFPLQTTAGNIDLLPNLHATGDWDLVDCIDPDRGIAYASTFGTAPDGVYATPGYATTAYDLAGQRVIGTFSPDPDLFGGSGLAQPGINTTGPFATVDGPFTVMGCVMSGGHRVWAMTPKNSSPPADEQIEVVDFDGRLVSPYAWVSGPQPWSDWRYSSPYYWFYWAFWSFANFTTTGDPIIVAQVWSPANGASSVSVSQIATSHAVRRASRNSR